MLYTSYDFLVPVARVTDWSSAFLPTGKHPGAVRDDINLYSPEYGEKSFENGGYFKQEVTENYQLRSRQEQFKS